MTAKTTELPPIPPEMMLVPFDHAEALQADITEEINNAVASKENGGVAWWGMVDNNFLDSSLAGVNVLYDSYIKEVTANTAALDYTIRFVARVCSRPYADVALNINQETVNNILDVFGEKPMPADPFAKVILFIAVRGPYFQKVLGEALTADRIRHEAAEEARKAGFTVSSTTRMQA